MEQQYEAADGSRYTDKDAQVIGPVLAAIAARHDGMILAPVVVAEAKPKASPLHRYLYAETDREAAQQRRLDLARHMIRSVKVVYKHADEPEAASVRAFVHVGNAAPDESAAPFGGYMPVGAARADDRYWTQVVAEMERTLGYAARQLHRHEHLPRFRERFGVALTAIDTALAPEPEKVAAD